VAELTSLTSSNISDATFPSCDRCICSHQDELSVSGPIPEMKPQPVSPLWPGLLVLSVLS
jgi:hypothetical protein